MTERNSSQAPKPNPKIKSSASSPPIALRASPANTSLPVLSGQGSRQFASSRSFALAAPCTSNRPPPYPREVTNRVQKNVFTASAFPKNSALESRRPLADHSETTFQRNSCASQRTFIKKPAD